MRVIIHRGANDVDVFNDAREAGYQGVEGDVMLCRDGPVMCHPSAALPRRTERGNLDYTVAEVIEVLANSKSHYANVPTLEQMLDMVHEAGMYLLLETKIRGTFREIEDTLKPFREKLVIISFDGEELEDASIAGFSTGMLLQHDPSRRALTELKSIYGFHAFLPNAWHLSRATVTFCQEKNIPVIPWTVNDPTRAKRMAEMGVTAIETDSFDLIGELPNVCTQG